MVIENMEIYKLLFFSSLLSAMEDHKSVSSEVPHHGAEEVVAHGGVAKIKATHKVYGKYSRWFLFIGYACCLLLLFVVLMLMTF